MIALLWKDLLLETRRKETLISLFVIGVLILLVFAFSLHVPPSESLTVVPGILWAAIVFSAMLGMGRTFLMERENGCLTALLLAPIDRGSLFLAKFLVNLTLLLIFEALLLPAFGLFFNQDLLAPLPALALVLAGGTVGLAAAGTLFALVALHTTTRELMLPLLVLPLQMPLLIAAVKCTEVVMRGQPLSAAGGWGNILLGFDVLFLTAGWLAFEYIAVEP